MRYPGTIAAGRESLETCVTDVMPTLLDLAGQPIPSDVQGTSPAAYLCGKRTSTSPRHTFSERVRAHPQGKRIVEPGTPASFAVRNREWKYIRYPDGAEFLYHLTDDPGEMRNLADDSGMTERKRELRDALEDHLRRTGFVL